MLKRKFFHSLIRGSQPWLDFHVTPTTPTFKKYRLKRNSSTNRRTWTLLLGPYRNDVNALSVVTHAWLLVTCAKYTVVLWIQSCACRGKLVCCFLFQYPTLYRAKHKLLQLRSRTALLSACRRRVFSLFWGVCTLWVKITLKLGRKEEWAAKEKKRKQKFKRAAQTEALRVALLPACLGGFVLSCCVACFRQGQTLVSSCFFTTTQH